MTGGAVDSPAGGGGSGGQRSKEKQSILSVNVKQVGGAFVMMSYHPGGDEDACHRTRVWVLPRCCSRQVVYPPWGTIQSKINDTNCFTNHNM